MSDSTAAERLDAIANAGPENAGPENDETDQTPETRSEPRDTRPEPDRNGLRIERPTRRAPELDTTRETPLWERDDAPAGSTEESLLVHENGKPVRVAGPTHYGHLANGAIVGSYGVGTHHDDGDGPVPYVAHYAG